MRDRRGNIDDDVRYSLDLLDDVIGEFDDGLTSSAESEAHNRRRRLGGREESHGSRLSINEQIDDIFSQLTDEIYIEERKERNVVRRSPTRNRFDPLPIPPISTNTHPPPIDRKKKPVTRSNSRRRTQERGRGQEAGRNSSLPAKSSQGDGILYRDSSSNKGRTFDREMTEVQGGRTAKSQPPPKPQKQKIHLKNASSERRSVRRRERSSSGDRRGVSREEQAVVRELKEKVRERSLQRTPSNRRGRGEDDLTIQSREGRRNQRTIEYRASPSDNQGSQQRSSQYERGSNRSKATTSTERRSRPSGWEREEREQEAYRRSQSLGPLMGPGRAESPESREVQRSGSKLPISRKSRGVLQTQEEDSLRSRSKSQGRREENNRSRTRDSGRDRTRAGDVGRDSGNSGGGRERSRPGDGGRDRGREVQTGRDSTNRDASRADRGRDRSRGEDVRLRSRSRGVSPTQPHRSVGPGMPPSPEEAQAVIDQMLPRYPYAIPPERQRSMIDLRIGEDFKAKQRRSMAVGPYEDLPPHLRNHLMPPGMTAVPPHIDEQLRFHHQMNIEAQRDLLVQQGKLHPMATGEIPLHPELLGHLPSRNNSSPSNLFSAFPTPTQERDSKVKRQKSKKDDSYKRESSLVSLPFEDGQRKKNLRSQSIDARDSSVKPFSLFQGGSSWLNMKAGGDISGRPSQHDQQWFMKEKNDLKSLPSLLSTQDSVENKLSRSDQKRSSFGMILKDKFQRNPNMYFPDTTTKLDRSDNKLCKSDSLSDTDTLIHNMSEGSFEKSSNNSNSFGSHSSGKSSQDSLHGTPRMKRKEESYTKPNQPPVTALLLPSSPGVILNKKTIRNYTPPQSTNMLKQFEGFRQHSLERNTRERKSQQEKVTNVARKSSMDRLIEDFHANLPPPTPVTRNMESSLLFSDGDSVFSGSQPQHSLKPGATGARPGTGTVTSQTSIWSAASSAASFDYHSVNSLDRGRKVGNRRREGTNLPSLSEDRGERVPPEGASSESPEPPLPIKEREKKPIKGSAKEAVADLMKSAESDDELSMLRKLISEGRISGMNEKPPMFTPPTPPSQSRVPSSIPPKQNSQATKSSERPRKSRDAPKPPSPDIKPPPATNEIKFISGRRINSEENVNDANDGSWRRRPPQKEARSAKGVQRSSSMHSSRDNSSQEKTPQDAALAQLIADSTEKKFKLNSLFKGMWKKKHYSFDLS